MTLYRTLADTTRSGQLHFPEFALAMYLCNLKLTGKSLPSSLPENIKNEVSGMVDIINFSITEESGGASRAANNAPDFGVRQNTSTPPTIQHPQPQSSNSQLLQSQVTGFPGQQPSFLSQPTGLQTQQTGYPGLQVSQPTGYPGSLPPMPPMPTGLGSNLLPITGPGGMAAPLNAQPTGRPGQWGLVNTPSSGLPNIDALQAQMMPQQGREQGAFTTAGLQGNAVIPWAITNDEKTRYDILFRAWDGMNKGYVVGSQGIEIFGQSGLEKPDLERIWTLADHGNKGRLDLDEFAVAMHLIYRKLNGYQIPNRLPPELVPPSTRNLSESIGTIRNLLNQESDLRKSSGASLLPQKTGVSYLKSHSFRGAGGTFGAGRKDGTVFRNNDEEVGYRSSARRRIGGGSPRPDSPSSATSNDDLTLDQLRKQIREKQILLDGLDAKDEQNAEDGGYLDRRDRREAEDLYRRIRRIQEDIDAHPDASLVGGGSAVERRALERQLQNLTDKIPDLASQVRQTEKAIADARLELFRLKDAKANPGSSDGIVGTGPGGSITQYDRVKARARQRTAALTGKKFGGGDDLGASERLEEETAKVRKERENNERMVRDVEDSVREFAMGIEDSLRETGDSPSNEHERRKWEDGLGVEDEVRDFIFDLQRSSREARGRAQERRGDRAYEPAKTGPSQASQQDRRNDRIYDKPAEPAKAAGPVQPPQQDSSSSNSGTAARTTSGRVSYSSFKTPAERAAYIKQKAEERMAERLAELGIKPAGKTGETAAQRKEREKTERDTKLREAEEKETERQASSAAEQGSPTQPIVPSKSEAKRPLPPPSRKGADKDAVRKADDNVGPLAREHAEQQRAVQQIE